MRGLMWSKNISQAIFYGATRGNDATVKADFGLGLVLR